MITVEKFLQCVRENAARVTHYQSGGDGRDGGCDCIGLIIGALRLAGEHWDGTHGSNYAARYEIRETWPVKITSEDELVPGMIVWKARFPGDPDYKLPDNYPKGQPDFYHVGVVMDVSPLTIMHCTKSLSLGIDGITEDHSLGKWSYCGELRQVNYAGYEPYNPEKDNMLCKDRVIADSGSTVNLRKKPSVNADILLRVPIGDTVEDYGGDETWTKVRYNGVSGYMMTKFLTPLPEYIHDDEPHEDNPEIIPDQDADKDVSTEIEQYKSALEMANSALEQSKAALDNAMSALEQIKKLLGGG